MSKFREEIVSNCSRSFLIKNLNEHKRLDGRAFDEFRPIQIEFGRDWGCCYVSLGNTRVVAQVSCEIVQPKSNKPSEGVLNINLELTPLAAAHFEPGRSSDLFIQLNRTLEKCVKDSKAVDLESLCVKVNEKVWALRVDINVLNHEGNILDCASVATLAALAHFRRPDVSLDGETVIIHKYSERDPIPTVIHHYPVCVSYAIFNESEVIVADPTLLEEGVADASLMIALNAYKEICGLHLEGSGSMNTDSILEYTEKATRRSCLIVEIVKEAVQSDKHKRLGTDLVTIRDCQQFVKSVGDLQTLDLDKWVSKNQRRKRKKNKNLVHEMEVDKEPSGVIKSLGKGTAILVPTVGDTVWEISDDEEVNID